MGCMGLFLTPFFLIGAGTALYPFLMAFTLIFGSPVRAAILDWKDNSDSESTSYQVLVRYEVANERFEKRIQTTGDTFQSRPVGSQVAVLTCPLAPGLSPIAPSLNSPWKMILFFLCFTAFWNLITWLFIYSIFIKPLQERRVVSIGIPVPGSVLAKNLSTDSDGDSTYSLTCTFATSNRYSSNPEDNRITTTSAFEKIEVKVSQKQFSESQIHDTVTVLYDPKNPRRNAVYRFSEFEAVSS